MSRDDYPKSDKCELAYVNNIGLTAALSGLRRTLKWGRTRYRWGYKAPRVDQ